MLMGNSALIIIIVLFSSQYSAAHWRIAAGSYPTPTDPGTEMAIMPWLNKVALQLAFCCLQVLILNIS